MSRIKEIEWNINRVLPEIRRKGLTEDFIKRALEEYGILEGTTRKLLATEDAKNFNYATNYGFSNVLYEFTKREELKLDLYYNEKTKLKFLEKYPNQSQSSYSRIFEKSKRYEEKFKKDLYDFTFPEYEEFLYDLVPLTRVASEVNGRTISAYIDWCMKTFQEPKTNEFSDRKINWDSYVKADSKVIFSKSEIDSIIKRTTNFQDLVAIQLMFEGVQGRALSELRNMKKTDVKDDGSVILYDADGKERNFKMSEEALGYINQSNKFNEYFKKNGSYIEGFVGDSTKLCDNSYVIRPSVTNSNNVDNPADKMVLYRRIRTIANDLGYPNLTPKNIIKSGIIYMAKQILDGKIEAGKTLELTTDDYLNIAKKFNIANPYQLRRYCNVEEVEAIYGKFSNNHHQSI